MSKEQSSATAKALQAVRGMNDVLPDEASAWHQFEETARDVFERYGYRNLRVPIVEPTPLFVRGIGQHTDVVEHEMYTFEDKLNGESLTLRPEATAGIVRAAIQHTPDATLEELRARLQLTVALSTLWRAIATLGLSVKKK